MNFQFYLEKLDNSKQFQKFMEENPEAFICSGFFVIDKIGSDNKQHIDYFIPGENKIYSFQMENDIQKIPLENLNNEIPEEILVDSEVNFDEIERLILNEMEQRGIKNKVQKLILSLQSKGGRNFFVGTIFVSGMGIIKVNIDLKERKVTDFEKKSFFNMVNIWGKKDKKE